MISKTISTKNATATIKYLLDDEAHHTNVTDERNLGFRTNNVYTDIAGELTHNRVRSQFSTIRKTAKNKNKVTQAEHIILSFSKNDFDLTNLSRQSDQALSLADDFFKDYFPEDSQYFMVAQADNKAELLHIHAVVNSVKMDGKVLDTNLVKQAKTGAFRDSINKYLSDNFERATGRKFEPVRPHIHSRAVNLNSNLSHARDRNTYVWKDDLHNRVIKCMRISEDLEDFENLMKKEDVTIKKRRASVGKDESGKKIYREAYTYSFVDKDGKNRSVRDFAFTKDGGKRGMGRGYTPKEIAQTISNFNARKEIERKIELEKELRREKVKRARLERKKRNNAQIVASQKQSDSVVKQEKTKKKDKDDGLSF